MSMSIYMCVYAICSAGWVTTNEPEWAGTNTPKTAQTTVSNNKNDNT